MTLFASLLSKTRRTVVPVILAGLVTALVLSVSPSATTTTATTQPAAQKVLDYTPVTGATFNRPVGTSAQQRAIFTVLNNSIDASPAGATIRFAVYSFAEQATASRLIAAHDRGVNVQLIFDDHVVYAAESRLKKALGSKPNARSFVILCHKSCRGTQGDMHDKIFLFSQAGKAQNIVNVGSDNITRHNAVDQWSDMYTVVGDPALYFTYSGVFEQMKYDTPVTKPYIIADVNGYQPQFYPKANVTAANDPLYEALSQITCLGVPAGAGSGGRTVLRLSQHAWNGDRGVYLAQKVAELETAGCNVRVIYGVGMGKVVLNTLKRAGVPMHKGRVKGVRTHQKLMFLSGWYGDNPAANIVWTGSHNWSNGALRRDETIFRIESADAYQAYLANFHDIWDNG